MNKLNLLSLVLLANLTLAFAAAPFAIAQDRGSEPDQDRERGRQREPEQERDPLRRPGSETNKPAQLPKDPAPSQPSPDSSAPSAQGGTKPNGDADSNGDPGNAAGHMNAKAAQKKILLEESKYRSQMARIARLRELATQQGNEQRLAALDKLEAKMTELHDRKIAAARASLGDKEFDKVNKELEKGRGRGKGASAGKGKGNDDRPGNSAGKGKPGDDDDRGKPDNAGRPGQSGGNGRGNNNLQSADNQKSAGGKPANAGGGGNGGGNDNKGGGKGKGKP